MAFSAPASFCSFWIPMDEVYTIAITYWWRHTPTTSKNDKVAWKTLTQPVFEQQLSSPVDRMQPGRCIRWAYNFPQHELKIGIGRKYTCKYNLATVSLSSGDDLWFPCSDNEIQTACVTLWNHVFSVKYCGPVKVTSTASTILQQAA